MEDFQGLLYLLLTLIFGILGTIGNKKNKKRQRQDGVPTGYDLVNDVFEDIRNEFSSSDTNDEMPNTNEEEKQKKEVVEPIEIVQEENEFMKYLKEKRNRPRISEQKPIDIVLESLDDNSESEIDFDLEKAVIYSEILKPKYF